MSLYYFFFRIYLFVQDLGKVCSINNHVFCCLISVIPCIYKLCPICHNFLKPLLEEWNRRFSVGSCDLKSPCASRLQAPERNGSKFAHTEEQGVGLRSFEGNVGRAPTMCEAWYFTHSRSFRGHLKIKAIALLCTVNLRNAQDLDFIRGPVLAEFSHLEGDSHEIILCPQVTSVTAVFSFPWVTSSSPLPGSFCSRNFLFFFFFRLCSISAVRRALFFFLRQ